MKFIIVASSNYEKILTTKISRFKVVQINAKYMYVNIQCPYRASGPTCRHFCMNQYHFVLQATPLTARRVTS